MDNVEVTFWSDSRSRTLFNVNSGATLSIIDFTSWVRLATDRYHGEDLFTYASRLQTQAALTEEILFPFDVVPVYDNENGKFALLPVEYRIRTKVAVENVATWLTFVIVSDPRKTWRRIGMDNLFAIQQCRDHACPA